MCRKYLHCLVISPVQKHPFIILSISPIFILWILTTSVMISTHAILSIFAILGVRGVGAHKLHARDCSFTWPAYAGDDCSTFVNNWGISEAQFLSYNPGTVCSSLEVGKEYCVEWSGTPPSLPSTRSSVTSATRTTFLVVTTTRPTISSTSSKPPVGTCSSTPAGVTTPSPIQVIRP